MTVRGLFVSGDGRLRAGWRVLVFIALFFAIAVVVSLLLSGPLHALATWSGYEDTAEEAALTLGILGAHVVMLRWVDRRAWAYVRLDGSAARRGVVGYGLVLGALPIAAASLALLAVGWLSFAPSPAGAWVAASAKFTVVLMLAALFEELTSRGYIFAALRDWMGAPAAVGITSVAFGLLHLGNPGASAQPIVMVTLAGIFLAVVLLATQSLYAAWAAHFAWNWVMAVPLHVVVSGAPVPRPGYQTVDSGPDWATGGTWGPEGGAFAAAAMLAGMYWMYVRHKRANLNSQPI